MPYSVATPTVFAWLGGRLRLPLPGAAAMASMAPSGRPLRDPDEALGAGARLAGALVLLYPDSAGAVHFPLTLRPDGLPRHGGQISLPGGSVDHGEAPEQAAVRELAEELGVAPPDLKVLGRLTPLYIAPSDFVVQPVVGVCASRPQFRPDGREVACLIEVPVQVLVGPNHRHQETRWVAGQPRLVPYFGLAGHKVWGATAMILAELAAVWSAAPRQGEEI